MKKLRQILLSLVLLCSLGAFAQTDSQGWPVYYLMSSQNGWSASSEYMFMRQGEKYTLKLNVLEGEFCIATKNWINVYKPSPGAHKLIRENGQQAYACSGTAGSDYLASGLKDVTITFNGNKEGTPTYINFEIGSVEYPVSGDLPVLYINVRDEDGKFNDEIIHRNLAHKDYFDAEYWLDLNGCQWLKELGAESLGSEDNPLKTQIKARGNYSRTAFSKKPFKLKLDKKQKMLGMTKSKHFTLLSHADDWYGYMRNFTAFALGKYLNLPWTPQQQPVELVINGNYRGLYFLTESIRVGDDRIMIEELADEETAPELISGGYVVELDNYWEDNQIRMTEYGYGGNPNRTLKITPDTPEFYSNIQRKFVYDQMFKINTAVGKLSNDLWAYLDMDDLVRYYLVCEITGHTEAFCGSTYLFRDRGEGQKWHFSPLWDFGHAFETGQQLMFNTTAFGHYWIGSIWQHSAFNAKLKETYKWFVGNAYSQIYDDLTAYVNHIRSAAKADHQRWKATANPDNGQTGTNNSDIDNIHNNVEKYLKDRITWLSTRYGTPDASAKEPARDTTPAAPLPDYATGIVPVIDQSEDADMPVIYYTIEGIEVKNPIEGNLYIIRQGSMTGKIIYHK